MHCQEGGRGWAAPELCAMGWGSPRPRAFPGKQPNAWVPPSFREQINNQAGRTGRLYWRLQRAEGGQLPGINGGLSADSWQGSTGGAERTERCG